MSEKSKPRRKQVTPTARAKAKICRKCLRSTQRGKNRGTRCYCVETDQRSQVIGRRRKKRATARRARRKAGWTLKESLDE